MPSQLSVDLNVPDQKQQDPKIMAEIADKVRKNAVKELDMFFGNQGWYGKNTPLVSPGGIVFQMEIADQSLAPKIIEVYQKYWQKEMKAISKKDKCFIATAVYGSPDVPEVLELRNFRDNILLTNKLGQIFVKYYYLYSPYVADYIGKNNFIKIIFYKFFNFIHNFISLPKK